MSLAAAATLVRWLGPWEKDGVPRDVVREPTTIDANGRAVRAWVHRPRSGRPRGVWIVAPGLHFLGPDDPRLDRFCRILAASGTIVVAPFLPDHLALRVTERTTDDLAAVVDHAIALAAGAGLPRPALFSISFGSQPAIAVAARDAFRDRLSALVLFGGFADFAASVRFSVTGRAQQGDERLELTHDPLNQPVVWLHLLEHLDLPCDRARVEQAWRTMVRRTWGQPHLKAKGARDPIARALAEELPPDDARVFLMGCGLAEGGEPHLERGLAQLGAAYAFADPTPHLPRVRAPIAIVHGRDDDVIPWFEAEKLRKALPPGHPHRVLLTGLYGHTGASMVAVSALGRELRTMVDVVRTLVDAPSGRFRGD